MERAPRVLLCCTQRALLPGLRGTISSMSEPASTTTPTPTPAPGTSPILLKVALVWAALAAIIPTIFGIVMLVAPDKLIAPGTTVVQTFATLAYRNFAFSAVLALAVATQPRRVVAFLLAARGLTEAVDGFSGVFIAHDAWVMPAIGGVTDCIFAWLLYRSDRGAPKT